MTDHRKREKIPESETCHIYLALRRNKENPNMDDDKPKVMRRVIRDVMFDLEILRSNCKAVGGVWRIYQTVNARSFEKANKIFQHKLIDDIDKYYYRLDSLWKTCLLQKKSRAEKYFLIDLDNEYEYWHIKRWLERNKIILYRDFPTPNGYHFITQPFNRNEFELEFPKQIYSEQISISVDGYWFVEMIR